VVRGTLDPVFIGDFSMNVASRPRPAHSAAFPRRGVVKDR